MTLTVMEVLLLSLNCLVLLLLVVCIFGRSSAFAVVSSIFKSLNIGSFSDLMAILQKYKSGEKIDNEAVEIQRLLDQMKR